MYERNRRSLRPNPSGLNGICIIYTSNSHSYEKNAPLWRMRPQHVLYCPTRLAQWHRCFAVGKHLHCPQKVGMLRKCYLIAIACTATEAMLVFQRGKGPNRVFFYFSPSSSTHFFNFFICLRAPTSPNFRCATSAMISLDCLEEKIGVKAPLA